MNSRLLRLRQCRRLAAAIAAVAALATLLPAAWAQDPQTEIPFDPEVRRGTLGNGMTYYIKVNPEPPDRIQLRLGVKAGSVLEEESERGLAHYLEHMAFNGTASFEGNEIIDYLESIGSAFGPDLNAYTSFDETVYLLEVPTDPDVVATAFDIFSEWAYAMTLDPEEVEKERGVVLEEWRLGRGAGQRIRDQQFPVLFGDSQYSVRLPIGLQEVIETASADDLRGFYERWYRPDLMAFVAVGDLDPDEMEALIREHFAPPPEGAAEFPRRLPDRYTDRPDAVSGSPARGPESERGDRSRGEPHRAVDLPQGAGAGRTRPRRLPAPAGRWPVRPHDQRPPVRARPGGRSTVPRPPAAAGRCW